MLELAIVALEGVRTELEPLDLEWKAWALRVIADGLGLSETLRWQPLKFEAPAPALPETDEEPEPTPAGLTRVEVAPSEPQERFYGPDGKPVSKTVVNVLRALEACGRAVNTVTLARKLEVEEKRARYWIGDAERRGFVKNLNGPKDPELWGLVEETETETEAEPKAEPEAEEVVESMPSQPSLEETTRKKEPGPRKRRALERTDVRVLKDVPMTLGGFPATSSNKNTLKPGSAKFEETLEFVRRKGAVSNRDVAARFGLSDYGARIRLSAGEEHGVLQRSGERGAYKWTAVAAAAVEG